MENKQNNILTDEQIDDIDRQLAVNRKDALDEIVKDHPGVCNTAKADITKEWQEKNSPSYHKATAFKWGGLLSTLSAAAIGVFSWFH
jgi:hypothetical protein